MTRSAGLPGDIAALLTDHHGVVTVKDAGKASVLDSRLRYWCRRGLLTRVGHGAYASAAELDEADSWRSLAIRGEGFVRSLAPAAFLVGPAAAAARGLRTTGTAPALPEVAAPPYTRLTSRSSPSGRVRRVTLPASHMRTLRGRVQVMSSAWVAVDLARRLPIAPALVMADGVTRAFVTESLRDKPRDAHLTGTDLAHALVTMESWPGVRRAGRIVSLADSGAETAIETAGRVAFLAAGLPASVSNAWLPVSGGRWRRADHLWPWHGVVGEADGALKYDDVSRPSSVVADEKEREWELRELGLVVGRYTWNLAERRHRELAARFRMLLDENPPRERPVRYWTGVDAAHRAEATSDRWPSPHPVRSPLPSGPLW